MKKSEKRLISVVLVISIVVSVFSICFNAFAKSQKLVLNVLSSSDMDGSEDLNWYYYTPEVSGTYSFLSFNRPHSEAYLFTKESDSMGTKRSYTQLAYSSESKDYASRGQNNIIQFCLTYHLEAGTTYYYAAGWWDSERTSGTMTVKLVCDEYDGSSVQSIALSCSASYSENENGSWETDSSGNSYFRYNLSRIIANMKITVNYADGTTTTETGKDEIDGHAVTFNDNQKDVHWYPKGNENYTKNTVTVTILGVSAEYEAEITESGLVPVTFKVTDYASGDALEGVTVSRNSETAESGDDGTVTISLKEGENTLVFSKQFAISREITVNLSSTAAADCTDNPVTLVTCDYNSDGVINGKDYVYISRNFAGTAKTTEVENFRKVLNFKKSSYDAVSMTV